MRTREATTLTAVVKEDGIEKGLDALFTETDRVARFGFTATELTRQKQLLQRAFERAVAEKDQQESASFADEFIRNFTTDEPIPGIVYESQLHQRFLPEITLAEINKLARNWASDKNRVVVVNAPDKPGLAVPDATKLAAVIKAASAKNLDRLRRRRHVGAARRNAAHAGDGREDHDQRGIRHHGVGAFERRESRPQADDVQG